ncbi:MAG: DEAD/DEAH box helicase [Coriobacteriales bacterium]|nr:DEAD/DEAH box helicase [Coriobacteriales bacterium]
MTKTFEELGLSKPVLDAINELGYLTPTPVQEQAIPLVLEGRDVVAAAQTGTGKTAAFMLPILDRLPKAQRLSNKGRVLMEGPQGPLCLVITPTRELAQQIDGVAVAVSAQTGHRTITVTGGSRYDAQKKALTNGVDVLVATPGRLIDLMDKDIADLSNVQVLVLDEADRMLDMGFWPSVRKIVRQLKQERQTLFFSATIDQDIMRTASGLLSDPAFVQIAARGSTAEGVEQYIMPVEQSQQVEVLAELIERYFQGSERILVFTRTKQRADACYMRLSRMGYNAQVIHADRNQRQREHALEDFRAGRVNILVATDVLARGIDIVGVDGVVNFDVPSNPEDYVHRVGRTGRAGRKGYAITLLGPDEITPLREIEYLLGKLIEVYDLPDFPYRSGRIVPNPNRPTKRQAHTLFRGMSGGRGRR